MNKETLRMASENLGIKMVYLHSTETKLLNDFNPLIPNQRLQGQFRTNTIKVEVEDATDENEETQRVVRFYVEANMRYVLTSLIEDAQKGEDISSEKLASSIKAVFVAEYLVINDKDIPKKALTEFGNHNAVHNVWPYWREYCQSTCSRMALPVIVIPLLRMPSDDEPEKSKD